MEKALLVRLTLYLLMIMQRFRIIHRTYYHFSQPVSLGQHSLRIYPKESRECRVESFSVVLNPSTELCWHLDAEDNSVAIANFAATTESLSIESDVVIQQYNRQPLNFLLEEEAVHFPPSGTFAYNLSDGNVLAPYRVLPPKADYEQVKQWIHHLWKQDEPIQTYALLERLCRSINQHFSYVIREEPGVQTAAETLRKNSGSCRDFSLLFIEAARCLGFAARFVSGYLHSPPSAQHFGATHAWAEIYLPGAGWKGFDPTVGSLSSADNIPVAVAASLESIPPIAGSFTGNADSTLNVGVWVTRI